MSRTEQIKYLTDHLDGVKKDILASVPKMPENWGHEELNEYCQHAIKTYRIAQFWNVRKQREFLKQLLDSNL